MKISVAQIRPVKGDVAANILKHKVLIDHALDLHSDAVFFPELSLTGYEPELAEELASAENDPRFAGFQKTADQNRICIGVGMPVKTGSLPHIGMIIFQPGVPALVYSKQMLHADELPYFSPGNRQLLITSGNERIGPAICYESLRESHAAHAVKLGAGIYLASVAKSRNGVEKAMVHYSLIAEKYKVPVLMANCIGHCDNFESYGSSAVFSGEGKLLAQLGNNSEGLLTFNTETGEVEEKSGDKL